MRFVSVILASFFFTNYAYAFGVTDGRFDGRDYRDEYVDFRQEGLPRELPEGSVKISKSGTTITADDFKNGIVYQIDLANPGEQPINQALITKIRESPGSRAIGRIIDKMSISDVKDLPGNRMTANVNIYLKNATPFGTLTGTLVLGVELVSATCPIKVITYHPGDYAKNIPASQTSTYNQVNCIQYEVATTADIRNDLKTGLPKLANAAVGLAADTVLKLMSPIFAQHSALYQIK